MDIVIIDGDNGIGVRRTMCEMSSTLVQYARELEGSPKATACCIYSLVI